MPRYIRYTEFAQLLQPFVFNTDFVGTLLSEFEHVISDLVNPEDVVTLVIEEGLPGMRQKKALIKRVTRDVFGPLKLEFKKRWPSSTSANLIECQTEDVEDDEETEIPASDWEEEEEGEEEILLTLPQHQPNLNSEATGRLNDEDCYWFVVQFEVVPDIKLEAVGRVINV
ncbi:hypothetical protein CFE70_006095 [Pyrenophora teres f. teres 0-1]|uniref:Uncharacterized protein n=2 Tax=Pyrenophora teres f. teres TaxID=97479 RepID=E3RVH3_PYRTT|nr:hypothetical protein PTT_13164 [Pyrenophora teres f. teres 0-1]CAE7179570.1 hypothetical protein PTTW11_06576 [Pyrenophora teres f. teres]